MHLNTIHIIKKGDISGALIALPADTCYGLAVAWDDRDGYEAIYTLKGRSYKKPLALLVRSFEDIVKFVYITEMQLDFLRVYPHPFTFLGKPRISLPAYLDPGLYSFLGMRVAERCIDANIRDSITYPLFLTSANRSGEKECFTRKEVVELFGTSMNILGEKSGGKLPSDVFSFINDTCEIEYRRRNYS